MTTAAIWEQMEIATIARVKAVEKKWRNLVKTKDREFFKGANLEVLKCKPFGEITGCAFREAVQDLEMLMARFGNHTCPRNTIRKCAMILATKGVKNAAMLSDVTVAEIESWMPSGLVLAVSRMVWNKVCEEAGLQARLERAAQEQIMRCGQQHMRNAWKLAEQLTPQAVDFM